MVYILQAGKDTFL